MKSEYLDIIREAEAFAEKAHEGQMRKGPSKAPYITHPLAVADILKVHNATTEAVLGGLLHDVVEDSETTLDEIASLFGDYVAVIVDYVTEPDHDIRPWKQRKKDYLARIEEAPYDAVLVASADKLHNLRDTLKDYKEHGDDIWSMFNSQKDTQFWYYKSLIEIFVKRDIPVTIITELRQALSEIHGRFAD